jgi:hypothetical protein
MDVASLTLSIPGLLSVCTSLGIDLKDRIQVYLQSDEIAKAYVEKFDNQWGTCKSIMECFEDIKGELSIQMACEVGKLLNRLRNILEKAVGKAAL